MSVLITLTEELMKLLDACDEAAVPIMIGGGLGLYLRDVYLQTDRSKRYPVRPDPRSTDDIDCLLSPDVITSKAKMERLRDIITDALGYEPLVKHMQFKKELDEDREVKIDLLTAMPDDTSTLKVKPPRVRPKTAKDIHAYRTLEAATVAFEPRVLEIEDRSVSIPSSINYLILKLHAFRDRRKDQEDDFGRHHALDIFRIVTGMDEHDWATVDRFHEAHAEDDHVREARNIRTDFFHSDTALGVLRLRENVGFKTNADEFKGYLEDFLADLLELFPPIE